MSDIVDRWMAERGRHPFLGESIGKERYCKVWDDAADEYDDAGVGHLKDLILERLSEKVSIDGSTDILDVGSGPGTYGVIFSQHCRSVVCLDSSQRMLDRIIGIGIGNIRCMRADWDTFETDDRFDLVFSSLCPALNDPQSLLKMESFSKGYCAYVSSMNDDSGSIRTAIWNALGKDYTLNGYDTRFPYEYLREIGRDPTPDIFDESHPFDREEGEVVTKEIENLSFYMDVDDKVRSIVERIVADHSVDGNVHYEGRKRLGLLCWKA